MDHVRWGRGSGNPHYSGDVTDDDSTVSGTVAAIDIGTNSVHMVVARIDDKGFTVVTSEKEVVRLGEGSEGLDHLTREAMDRGVAALAHMRRVADAHGATIRAVATSAVREAGNADIFVTRVREECGITVEVISGIEEARLIALGVRQSLNLGSDDVVMIDIGGGSTEVTLGNGRRTRIAQSIKLGAVRLTDRFLSAATNDVTVRNLRSHVRMSFANLAHEIAPHGFDRVVLSSGTCETLARIAAAMGGAPPRQLNGFRFDRGQLDAVVEEVLRADSVESRRAIGGMDPRRADIIVAGAVILQEMVRALGAEVLEYSEYALREGVLIDCIQRMRGDRTWRTNSALDSARRLADRCSVDMEHAGHVAAVSLSILRSLARSYEVDLSLAPLLEAAAILANVGNAVSYSRHHHHSYYIIRNADLVGFSDAEIETIALVSRYHRKGGPKKSHPEFEGLDEESRHDVELLAGILRIATGLDRSHDRSVSIVNGSVRTVAGRDTFIVSARCSAGDEVAELNRYTAQSRTGLLEEYLGDPVLVQVGA